MILMVQIISFLHEIETGKNRMGSRQEREKDGWEETNPSNIRQHPY
jgi:hypothetical protein